MTYGNLIRRAFGGAVCAVLAFIVCPAAKTLLMIGVLKS
jgi:hypothetical protein